MTAICSRCVSDTSIPGIRFDAAGVCNYCAIHDAMERRYPLDGDTAARLERKLERIRRRGRPYDIVVGVSGGRDSTYALYTTVKLGLRPLAVHFDNGWNSEIAVTNIRNATTKLGVDLHTVVADWDEFRTLQVAFLKASVPDAEIPTDVAIHGTLHRVAAAEGIRTLVFAHSFRTEGIMPLGWTYMDGRYIDSVRRAFGQARLRTVPNFTLKDFVYYSVLRRIEALPILNYLNYRHADVDRLLRDELGWKYYGGHHHESYYTHFFQSYYLPKKFGIDKRKIEFSALVRSGQRTRDDALAELERVAYPFEEDLVRYVINKLGLRQDEFDEIMSARRRTFRDYRTYYPYFRMLKAPLRVATELNLFPKLVYYKFAS